MPSGVPSYYNLPSTRGKTSCKQRRNIKIINQTNENRSSILFSFISIYQEIGDALRLMSSINEKEEEENYIKVTDSIYNIKRQGFKV